jgi:mono/diheme cytochrome c family protein
MGGMMSNNRMYRRIALAVLATMTVAGCAGMAGRVPPVDEAMVVAAAPDDVDRETLERGRTVYLRDCGRCHTPVSVNRYDEPGWREILPRMYEKAYLSSQEASDLRGYILTVSRMQADH